MWVVNVLVDYYVHPAVLLSNYNMKADIVS